MTMVELKFHTRLSIFCMKNDNKGDSRPPFFLLICSSPFNLFSFLFFWLGWAGRVGCVVRELGSVAMRGRSV